MLYGFSFLGTMLSCKIHDVSYHRRDRWTEAKLPVGISGQSVDTVYDFVMFLSVEEELRDGGIFFFVEAVFCNGLGQDLDSRNEADDVANRRD